jgi:hypothetical protein
MAPDCADNHPHIQEEFGKVAGQIKIGEVIYKV